MAITHSFIRSLSGLSTAELPDSVIDDLELISYTETWLSAYDTTSMPVTVQNYYMGYKAITLMDSYITAAVPQKIKDNFNEITRFDTLKAMIQQAYDKVAELETPTNLATALSRFDVVVPNIDPVTGNAR